MADDTYAVRLLKDGPSAWSNHEGWRATQDKPVITGLTESQANTLVESHPFEHAEISGDADLRAIVSMDASEPQTVGPSDATADSEDSSDSALDADADASDSDTESVDPPFDPSAEDRSVDDVETKLEEGDYSAAELDALAEAEANGKDRKGVADAIDEERNDDHA